MKKTFVVFAIVLVLVVTASVLTVLTFWVGSPDNLVIDGQINSCYNGYFPDLVRKDNELYYCYYGNAFNSGIYRISSKGSERMLNANVRFLPGFSINIPSLFLKNNTVFTTDDCYEDFNVLDTSGKEASFSFALKSNEELINAKIFNNEVFIHVDCYRNNQHVSKLYMSTGIGFEEIFDFDEKVSDYYVLKNNLYWICEQSNGSLLYKSSLASKGKCLLRKLDYTNVSDLFVCDNYAYICSSNMDTSEGVSLAELNRLKSTVSLVDLRSDRNKDIFTSRTVTAACYGNDLYLCGDENDDNKGLFVFSAENFKLKKLTDEYALNFYVLDDKYVYYTDSGHRLYRMTLDGENVEKVFG